MLKLIHAFDMNYEYVQEYYEAFDDKWRDLNCYAIFLIREGKKQYYNQIKNYDQNLYYLIDDENPTYIIGFGSIEDKLDYHKEYLNTGNISYGIRPAERGKGYGTDLLHLLLAKCEDFGMDEVCISCKKNNIASQHIIENNNGIFEKEFSGDFDDSSFKYWIKLKPKILNRIYKIIGKNVNR